MDGWLGFIILVGCLRRSLLGCFGWGGIGSSSVVAFGTLSSVPSQNLVVVHHTIRLLRGTSIFPSTPFLLLGTSVDVLVDPGVVVRPATGHVAKWKEVCDCEGLSFPSGGCEVLTSERGRILKAFLAFA